MHGSLYSLYSRTQLERVHTVRSTGVERQTNIHLWRDSVADGRRCKFQILWVILLYVVLSTLRFSIWISHSDVAIPAKHKWMDLVCTLCSRRLDSWLRTRSWLDFSDSWLFVTKPVLREFLSSKVAWERGVKGAPNKLARGGGKRVAVFKVCY